VGDSSSDEEEEEDDDEDEPPEDVPGVEEVSIHLINMTCSLCHSSYPVGSTTV